ncbi:MAG: molybdopterin-dependent oxidoreductase, partial [Alphaproteobacteria bacterium]
MTENQTTAYRICPFCEATCGLKLTLEGREVVDVRGDEKDPFSRGYICPKGTALKHLHEDPDRLTTPLIKEDGVHREASFDEAFALIEQKLLPIREVYGADAIALYNGNPGSHNLSHMLYGGGVAAALGSRNRYSAATTDQMPRHMASGLMFGTWASVPVPDIDRCDLLVLLGTNPIVSNGSMWTVPDFRGRLKELQGRGGEMVVIDPRRTRTANLANQHLFITPGTDAYLLAAILNVLFVEGLADAKQVQEHVSGMAALAEAVEPFTPQRAAGPTGISADEIEALARKIAATDRCAVHGRMGVNTQKFGSLNSFLIDAINVVAGNLDREGGAMFPKAAAFAANTRGAPGRGRGIRPHGKPSRVRGLPSVMGEYPVATLAEEIETEGEGQIRGLITMAGNPVLSNPN